MLGAMSLAALAGPVAWSAPVERKPAGGAVDFQREVRPVLSQNCFLCHGPDEHERKGGLRLDVRENAVKPAKSGVKAIVPGHPEQSELLARIRHGDPDEQMPPAKSGKKLSAREIEVLAKWIAEGAPYANHWSYEKPLRPALPETQFKDWPRQGLDYFVAQGLEKEALAPAAEADRNTLIRRVALDLTGLPPTPEEVWLYLNDPGANAYEKMAQRFLDKPAYGEHWARMWLDLARYADSAGYADDPLRTIWRYRDYVIRAFNQNLPFDQFTIEQIAGDLLENPTEDQLAATAFHRNTMTNSEGGTNDEEFRSAAVVDRVNTTMAVWMGTSMACAQCHTHKYDPLTQEEYFQIYALLNNTEDADRPDESPTLKFFTVAQEKERAAWQAELAALERTLAKETPELKAGFEKWAAAFPRDPGWSRLKDGQGTQRRELATSAQEDGTVVSGGGKMTETFTVEFPIAAELTSVTGLKIELGAGKAENAKITRVAATLLPPKGTVSGRYIRIELPGRERFLSLAEVQVFSGRENIAPTGEAAQSSTDLNAPASLAIDGNTSGNFNDKTVTHTAKSENPWWELDLKAVQNLRQITVWNRTDSSLQSRLADFRVVILDQERVEVWENQPAELPNPSLALPVDGPRKLRLAGVYASTLAPGSAAASVLVEKADAAKGWTPAVDDAHPELVLLAEKPATAPKGSKLQLTLEQSFEGSQGLLESFKASAASSGQFPAFAPTPSPILSLLASGEAGHSGESHQRVLAYYLRQVAPELAVERERAAERQRQIEAMKPGTVPILRELAGDQRRKTKMQLRGNYLDTGKEVVEGVPAAFHPLPPDAPRDRMALARWLVSADNPLTARVVVNRFWEQIFGIGLVRTSEEFGAQGEQPSHPELLDWLAVEFMAQGWDMKQFLKMLVCSAAYRQSSKVSPELAERDPENRLLARGPRFRMSAETVRDQALYVAGLLSEKMDGPSVKPLRPSSGLSAAFGSSVDWKTSDGEDRFRRGLYTEWRRTSPYPSMATFDAPNREVCTLRRTRTNTPLQALVTLNDPVYIEAAQGLARRMMAAGPSAAARIGRGFELCLARSPSEAESARLAALLEQARQEYQNAPAEQAQLFASLAKDAPLDAGAAAELAAWTAVANVLLNLDETFMKR